MEELVDCRPGHEVHKPGTVRAVLDPYIEVIQEFNNGTLHFKCKYCPLSRITTLHRAACHLAKIRNAGIVICPCVPDSVRDEVLAVKGITPSDYGPPSGSEGLSQRTSTQPSQLFRSSQDSVKTSSGQCKLPPLFDRSGEKEVHMAVAEMVIGLGLPFETVNQPLFHEMCRKINNCKSQYKPPTSYQMRTTLLRDTVAAVKSRLKVSFSSLSIHFMCSI